MKAKYTISLFTTLVLMLLIGCEKDNFTEPTSKLTGKITYGNEQLSVRSNALQLELWQHGYQNFTKIPVHINQDGSFSAMLFDGNYKLVRMSGSPWENNTDSIDVTVKGNTVVDVPVVPYFTVDNVSFQKSGTKVTATFKINQVSTKRSLKSAKLYLGKTMITDNGYNIANASISAANITIGSTVTLTATIPAAYENSNVFARVAVETDGIGQFLYSLPEKIQ